MRRRMMMKNLQNLERCYHSLDPKEPLRFQVSPPRLLRAKLFDRPEKILDLKENYNIRTV